MFDERAFRSWSLVLVGAMCFAGLFALVPMMSGLLLDGVFTVTPLVISFGLLAFVGYLGVATLIRHRSADGKD